MLINSLVRLRFVLVLLALCAVVQATPARADAPIKIFATLPDLGSIARSIGGSAVAVTVMIKGGEDPHFVEAKPSFIKILSESDMLLLNGLELEVGYVPLLLQNARNPRVLPGNPGYVDCSTAVTPLEVPAGTVDRSMGDVHPFGNPHYLTDPINGVKVADLVRAKLTELRPQLAGQFANAFAAFKNQVAVALVGEVLAKKYDVMKLALLADHGQLDAFLGSQGDTPQLAGWLGAVRPYRGTKFVDDHNIWPYFSARFGLELFGHLEPKPGIPPSTSHLGELIAKMQEAKVHLLIAAPYYDPRHARFVADNTGARVATLAHLSGAVPGTTEYVQTIDHNVHEIIAAVKGGG